VSVAARPQTCLVVGAAGGLGAAIASRFLGAGWSVLGWDIAPIADARITRVNVDVTRWDDVAVAGADLPPLDAVINCCGIASRTRALELDPAEFDRVLRVNLVAAFALSRATFPALQAAAGTLVHLASVGGHLGFHDRLAYDTSKAGLLSMVRHLGIEWAPHGVRVISVSPGFVRTGMAERGIAEGSTSQAVVVDHTPVGRLVEPAEVADAIVALVGPAFAGMTASDVLVDGGFAALSGF